MIKQELKSGAFVRHRSEQKFGIGRVVKLGEDDQQVEVEFQNESGPWTTPMEKDAALRSLDILPEEGFEVTFWKSPDTVKSWVSEGQLRLVAAALADLGGSGRVKDIEDKLESILEPGGVKFSNWWKKVRPAVNDSDHFTTGQGKPIILNSEVTDVAVGPLPIQPKPEPKSGEYQKQLDDQRAFYEKRLEQQGAEYQKQLDDQRAFYEKRLEQQGAEYQKQLDDQRAFYEKRLGDQNMIYRQEEEHLRQQIHDLNARMAASREESSLDIRRDMLLVLGEAIQLMYQQRAEPEIALRDVEAGMILALGAGGAQLLEIPDALVKYNPTRHKAEGETVAGTPMRVYAPGVIVPSARLGDATLLKALVHQVSGD